MYVVHSQYFLQIVAVSRLFILLALYLFGDDVFEKAPHHTRREEPLKQSPPDSVFCLRNNFFVGRLAVFSGEGSIRGEYIFHERVVSAPLLSAGDGRGDKKHGWRIREKTPRWDRRARVRRRAILPQPKQTHSRNRGNYPGHTLHRRGNIEFDVMVARATRCVLVRGFEHSYVAFMSVLSFLRGFFLRGIGDAISRSAVIVSYPDKAFRLLNDRVP